MRCLRTIASSVLLACAAAHADFVDINLAGYNAVGPLYDPGNSGSTFQVPAGSFISGYEWTNLTISTVGPSAYLRGFVLSVDSSDLAHWMDARATTAYSSGTYGPANGSFATSPSHSGAAFTSTSGTVVFFVYDDWIDDPGVDITASSGTLRVFYTLPEGTAPAVPEPATYGLMSLGLLATLAASRRWKS